MSKILELFGISTASGSPASWSDVVDTQHCPYLDRKCLKKRKSQPEISIGTCSVRYGHDAKNVIICPHRLLQRKKIFTDCIHLLTLHEPGNEFHVVSEVRIPGGSVDYFLVSAKSGEVVDFVGIELQTLDTTGTIWPERQRLLNEQGLPVDESDRSSTKPFGMNWKMTAKTILVQLHHKIETFEYLSKHLVLVAQDHLIEYMRREFSFDHLKQARLGDPMHFHTYAMDAHEAGFYIELSGRLSTNAAGIAACLGLHVSPNVEFEQIRQLLESRLSDETLLTL